MSDVAHLKSLLGVHPDFPQKGIIFLDIFPLLQDPVAFESLLTHFLHHLFASTIPKSVSKKIDVVVGLDARGFLLGPIIALRLGCAFVPVRKSGKLPGEVLAVSYKKEYGTDSFEMQKGAIKPGQNVIVIDDLIATGGSAFAAGELITQAGGNVLEYLFIIELTFLKGTAKLNAPSFSIVEADD